MPVESSALALVKWYQNAIKKYTVNSLINGHAN